MFIGFVYFISEFQNKVLFAAVDCTGHGVPGALMSVIGFNSLTQAVRKTKINTPGKVLSFLDESVNEILRQTDDESGVKDSMDLAVCTVDFKKKELMYAGAYNPLYYVQDKPIKEQGEILERTLTEWQGNEDQIDDILVMGVQI